THLFVCFISRLPPHPSSTLFPYTTLFRSKLIAEPWDVGPGGYQVGNFPVLWTEWNGRFRDTIRRFWKGEGGLVNEVATRLAGSRSEEHTSELQSRSDLVCRLLLEKKKQKT